MTSGSRKLLIFARQSIAKQCQVVEMSEDNCLLKKKKEEKKLRSKKTPPKQTKKPNQTKKTNPNHKIPQPNQSTFHSERCVSLETFCFWFRNYCMKLCDMQEVILCDHNSLLDLKIHESIYFLLCLLSVLKSCQLSWDQWHDHMPSNHGCSCTAKCNVRHIPELSLNKLFFSPNVDKAF